MVQMHLKLSGVKTRHIKVDDNIEKKTDFLKNNKTLTLACRFWTRA